MPLYPLLKNLVPYRSVKLPEERFKLLNYKKDGTTFINYLTMIPIFDENEICIYSLGIQSDTPWKMHAVVPA